MAKDEPGNATKPPAKGVAEPRPGSEAYFGRFGPLMLGRDLWKALGYPSFGAFVMARRRGTVPVSTFEIPMRRGVFAYTADVAHWVAQVQLQASADNPKE